MPGISTFLLALSLETQKKNIQNPEISGKMSGSEKRGQVTTPSLKKSEKQFLGGPKLNLKSLPYKHLKVNVFSDTCRGKHLHRIV